MDVNDGVVQYLSQLASNNVTGQMTGNNSITAVAADQYFSAVLRSREKAQSGKPVINLSHCLSESQWAEISRLYPEYAITRSDSRCGNHGLAANFRRLEIHDIFRNIGTTKKVVDVGGNPMQHLTSGRLLHCCQPPITLRDGARITEQSSALDELLSPLSLSRMDSDSLVYRACSAFAKSRTTETFLCRNKSEDCNVPADVCTFIHSIYDIDFDKLPCILEAHGASVGYGVFLFPSTALVAEKGKSDSHDFRYSIDPVEDTITYYFNSDSSLSYRHKWSALRKYVTRSCVKTKNYSYLYEIYSVRGDAFFFKLIRSSGHEAGGNQMHNVWVRALHDKCVVRVPELINEYEGYYRENVRMVQTVVPKALYEGVASWLATYNEMDFRQLMNYARSHNRRIVVNGTTVTVPESVPIESLRVMCRALLAIERERKVRDMEADRLCRAAQSRYGIRSCYHFLFRRVRDCSLLVQGIETLRLAIIDACTPDPCSFEPVVLPAMECTSFYDEICDSEEFNEPTQLFDSEEGHTIEGIIRAAEVDEVGSRDTFGGNQMSDIESDMRESTDTEGSDRYEADNMAIREYIATLEAEKRNTESAYRSVYDRMIRLSGHMPPEIAADSQGYKFMRVRDVEGYSRCVVSSGIMDIEAAKGTQEFCLVGSALQFPCPSLKIKVAKDMLSVKSVSERVVIQGVPGCGKTYHVVNNAAVGSLVVSPLKASVADLKKEEQLVNKTGNRGIRTHDSIIYAGQRLNVTECWLDESSTIHEGANVVVERLSGAQISYRMGDVMQVPAVNSTAMIWKYDKPAWHSHYEFMNVTRRCPADAAAAMTLHYKKPVLSHTGRVNGYDVRLIGGVGDVKYTKNTVYMTMYRDEVAQLRAALRPQMGADVDKLINTVHAFQGATYDHSVIVRLMPHDKQLYSNANYVNVGVTRHRKTCTYYTVKTNDFIAGRLRAAKAMANANIAEFMTSDGHTTWATGQADLVQLDATTVSQYDGTDVYETEDDEITRVPQSASAVVDRVCRDNGFDDDIEPTGCGQLVLLDRQDIGNKVLIPKVRNPVDCFQTLYDEIFPGLSILDNTYDKSNVHFRDLIIHMCASIRFGYENAPKLDNKFLRSLVRTAYPLDAVNTLTETLLAFNKRNANVPCVAVPVDTQTLYEDIWHRGIVNMFRKDSARSLSCYSKAKVSVTKRQMTRWWNDQDEKKQANIIAALEAGEVVIDITPTDKLSLLTKAKRKPMMSMKAASEYPASQTLTYCEKVVNMFYMPCMHLMESRLKKILKPNVVMTTDKSDVEIERLINAFCDTVESDYLEIDISKFDKSQMSTILGFEMFVYEKLGLDGLVSELYAPIYGKTRIDNFKVGFAAYLEGQRKSGAPTTLLGNTIVNMFAVNYALNINEFDVCLFKGDDSIIINPRAGDYNFQLLETYCNFDAKPYRSSVGYFCSSYLVHNSERKKVLVPDPIKRIETLGHNTLKDERALQEKFISMGDLMRNYKDPVVRYELAEAVQKRLGKSLPSLSIAVDALASISDDYTRFRSLWCGVPTDVHY